MLRYSPSCTTLLEMFVMTHVVKNLMNFVHPDGSWLFSQSIKYILWKLVVTFEFIAFLFKAHFNVGYVITTFSGKYLCFQEFGLHSSRVTARLRCFHNFGYDVILQWHVSRKLNICWIAWPLENGRIGCPGSSVNIYQLRLHNNGNIVVTLVNRGIRRLFLGLGKF